MDHTTEDLNLVEEQEQVQEKKIGIDRPLYERILAAMLIVVLLFGFIGMCYWLAFYGV